MPTRRAFLGAAALIPFLGREAAPFARLERRYDALLGVHAADTASAPVCPAAGASLTGGDRRLASRQRHRHLLADAARVVSALT